MLAELTRVCPLEATATNLWFVSLPTLTENTDLVPDATLRPLRYSVTAEPLGASTVTCKTEPRRTTREMVTASRPESATGAGAA